ncbi:MAG: PIN domain-containing protein [Ardenticatenales bacterium]|nr:PIN domain-containing protein [Ardenticatenales bacterium]
MTDLARGLVIDTSVLVADAWPSEAGHAESKALLAALADHGVKVHVPAIVLAEIAAAITRAVGDPWLAQRAAEAYGRRPGMHIVPVDLALAHSAARLAAEQRLRGCDAIYVALARTLGAALITLDGEQRERTPSSVHALTPGDALAWFQR